MAPGPERALSGLLLLVGALAGAAAPAAAVPLLLDTTFGNRGVVLTPVVADRSYLTEGGVEALALQADGKLIAAGGWCEAGPSGCENGTGGFMLVRYEADGTLDASFGTEGVVRTLIPPTSGATALAVQPDGKIVAGGFWCDPGAYGCVNRTGGFALARYEVDGTLDASFGTGGTVTTAAFSLDTLASVYALVLQPDGKIVAAGTAARRVALARYLADGALDASFGSGGTLTESVGFESGARALVALPDGRLVAAGVTFTLSHYGGGDFLLLRLRPDGSRDTGFGTDGFVVTDVAGAHDEARALAVLPDGRLVAGGAAAAPHAGDAFGLARYDADGALDASFGAGGRVRTEIELPAFSAREQVSGLAALPDGGIVAVGTSAGGYVALARYTPDGSLDPSFPSGGTSVKALGPFYDDAHALVLQPDGRAVAAGAACEFPFHPCHFGLVRFDLSPCNCPPCEHCDASGTCVGAPQGGCRAAIDAGAPRLVLHRGDGLGDDRLRWHLARGQRMAPALFGNPRSTDAYTLCLYDESGGTPRVVFSATAPPGSACETETCWRGRLLGRRLDFRSDGGAPEGLARIRLTAGIDERATVLVEGKGASLAAPDLPLPLPFRVQLQGSHGQCWEARYTTAERNDAGDFAASGAPP